MVKINEVKSTATFAFSNDPIPILATGTAAGVIDDSFSSSSTLDFYELYSNEPLLSIEAESKFYDLNWSKSGKIVAGALENGKIQFWDTEFLHEKKSVTPIISGEKHSGAIKSLQFNPHQHNILVSGGASSEIYIWDTNKISTQLAPFAPGTAMTPMDTINCVSWNNAVSQIFASAGTAGYTSIWDLKAKKEVLHLSYSSQSGSRATLSTVAWHPTQSTKLLTASESDGVPVILAWDLRNSNAPESILTGHKKGILSLDWNSRDPSLLLSSGKDNTTMLWNPLTSQKIAQYPTTANWAFKTRFAPSTPDIFATASFDKKVIVQTLQDTSPPISQKIGSTDETEFWNQISENETQQVEYFATQAPNWYGRKSSVSFGFGGKIVLLNKSGDKSSEIKIQKTQLFKSLENESLSKALDSSDFKEIIEARLKNSCQVNKSDWELLEKLSGETDIFEKFIKLKLDDSEQERTQSAEDADFFTHLGQEPAKFVPSGSFKLPEDSENLNNALLTKNFSKAIDISLKDGKLVEALIIALNGSQDLKDKVKNYYFNKQASDDSVARLLYSVSSNDVSDLVENGDISDWRQIASAIKNYSSGKNAYKTYFNKLGDRIFVSDPVKNRDDAILNYINASSLDKVANIWTDELKTLETQVRESDNSTSAYDAHIASLTEFVEKFCAYRSTLKLDTPITESERFISTILEYTTIISNNGQFELAYKFLNLLSDSIPAVKLEKERISNASGQIASTTNSRNTTAGAAATSGNRYTSLRNNQPQVAASPARGRQLAGGNPYLPQAPVGPAAPVAGGNPYAVSSQPVAASSILYGSTPSAQTAHPYAQSQPAMMGQSGSTNPYKPVTSAVAAQANPYKPNDTMPSSFAPPQASSGPPKNGRKVSTDGWNDLPSTFHAKPIRAPTPAAAVSVNPSLNSIQQPSPQGPGTLSRATSFANQPAVPPPPRSVSKSRKASAIDIAQKESPALVPNNRYAPVSQSPQLTSAPLNNNGFTPRTPSFNNAVPLAPPKNYYSSSPQPPMNQPMAPPTNPYAPSPSIAHSTLHSGVNSYAPPAVPMAQPPTNPYGPSPASQNPQLTSSNPYAPPPVSHVSQVAPPNPYGPSAGGQGMVPGPPRSGPPRATSLTASDSIQQAENQQQQFQQQYQQQHHQQQQMQQQIPEEPVKPKHPAGDRSHIPEAQLNIYKTLDSNFQNAKPLIPEKFSKQIIDTEKRLNILYDRLNNEDLPEPVLDRLENLVQLLSQKDTTGANDAYLDLAQNFPKDGGHWLIGIKRLVQFVDAVSH